MTSKYVPPAVRHKLSGNSGTESEKILRLRRQLKGKKNKSGINFLFVLKN